MNFLKRLTRYILFFVNILLVVLLIFTSFSVPEMSPDRFWPVSFLGLAFPFMFFLVLAFFFFWLIFYVRYCFLSLLAILICWKFVSVIFAFHPFVSSAETKTEKDSSGMTIMSYNVRYFKDFDRMPEENAVLRREIMTLIKDQHPDILCLQEFYTSENPHDFDNKSFISKEMGLPYRYFSSNRNYENNHSGVIIFSRYPIINAAKVKLLKNNNREVSVYADIVQNTDTIRVFTMHLQSIYLHREDIESLNTLSLQKDTSLVASMTILKKLRLAFMKRAQQARIVSKEVENSPYPVILCGDFNDPPNSYAYFKIRGNLRDAFLEKGFGLGQTYTSISPTLRIDYILASQQFQVNGFYRIKKELSDHYPIVAEISLRKNSN